MSDSVFSVGLRSAEYYRELKKLGSATDTELKRVERRLDTFERRADRAMQRRLTATQRGVQAELARIAEQGARANAEINSRLERETLAARSRADAALLASHRRREMRTAVHARRMMQIEAGGVGGRMRTQGIGAAASMAGLPGVGRAASLGAAGLGPAAVIGAGLGTAALGAGVVRGATAQSPEAMAALNKAQADLSRAYQGVVRDSGFWAAGVSKAVGVAGSALAKVWNSTIDTAAFYLSGGDAANIRGVNEQRSIQGAMDGERARRMAGQSVGDSIFGVDPGVARRRSLNQALDANGLRGSSEGTELLARLDAIEAAEQAAAEAEAKREVRRGQALQAQQRAAAMTLDAQIAGERARGTETLDDDKRAAQLLYLAQLEESRVRILADEAIPEAEKQNRITRESLLLGAQYASVLAGIDEAEQERARRLQIENEARAAAVDLFKEQLAIEEAMALGQKGRAEELRREADLRRRLEEITRLGLTGDERARAEASARAIFEAGGTERGAGRTIGFSGLAGGATLMRQMAGAAGPQARVLEVARKQVRVLEQIRDKIGAAPAVAG
jgi:single-stranded DNA-binding protein